MTKPPFFLIAVVGTVMLAMSLCMVFDATTPRFFVFLFAGVGAMGQTTGLLLSSHWNALDEAHAHHKATLDAWSAESSKWQRMCKEALDDVNSRDKECS